VTIWKTTGCSSQIPSRGLSRTRLTHFCPGSLRSSAWPSDSCGVIRMSVSYFFKRSDPGEQSNFTLKLLTQTNSENAKSNKYGHQNGTSMVTIHHQAQNLVFINWVFGSAPKSAAPTSTSFPQAASASPLSRFASPLFRFVGSQPGCLMDLPSQIVPAIRHVCLGAAKRCKCLQMLNFFSLS